MPVTHGIQQLYHRHGKVFGQQYTPDWPDDPMRWVEWVAPDETPTKDFAEPAPLPLLRSFYSSMCQLIATDNRISVDCLPTLLSASEISMPVSATTLLLERVASMDGTTRDS